MRRASCSQRQGETGWDVTSDVPSGPARMPGRSPSVEANGRGSGGLAMPREQETASVRLTSGVGRGST